MKEKIGTMALGLREKQWREQQSGNRRRPGIRVKTGAHRD